MNRNNESCNCYEIDNKMGLQTRIQLQELTVIAARVLNTTTLTFGASSLYNRQSGGNIGCV